MTYRDRTATERELEQRLREEQRRSRRLAFDRTLLFCALLSVVLGGWYAWAADADRYAATATAERRRADYWYAQAAQMERQRDDAWEALDTCVGGMLEVHPLPSLLDP